MRSPGRMRLLAGALLVLAVGIAILVLVGGGGRKPVAPVQPAPLGPERTPAPSAEAFGASVNSLFNYSYYSPSLIDAQLAELRGTGATLARSDALWEATEPAAPTGGGDRYRWRFDDTIAGTLARHGLTWLPIVDYTAPWAASIPGQEHSPPRPGKDSAAFAAFAAALATRYGPGGAYWRAHPGLPAEPIGTYEIWNEPDVGFFWQPGPDASAYVQLYLLARDAIRSVDPTARVLVGGLGHPLSFVPAMIAARPGVQGHIDGVAIHPYSPRPPQVLASIRADRAMMNAAGLATVPLYITELGWSTRPAHDPKWAPPSLRPRYIEQTLSALAHTDCGIAATLLYSWITPERDPGGVDDWFGINPPGGGGSADTRAFAAALNAARAPGPQLPLCTAGVSIGLPLSGARNSSRAGP